MMFKEILACVVIVCFITVEAARVPGSYYRRRIHERKDFPMRAARERFWKDFLQRRSCVPLGKTGCEANHGKCCRDGDSFTGTMRQCVNTGSFSSPVYTCQE